MTNTELVKKVYADFPNKVAQGRRLVGRPLTFTEKILMAHLSPLHGQTLERKKSTVTLSPDRVAMQDATAQMALLQFMSSGIAHVQAPTTVHCDHLIRAHTGASADLSVALSENKEVYDFLKSVSQKYGIGFWQPGAGIIHQVVLENYAFPGGMMIGTDSHTPNAGGLGMIAIGVGGADAVDVMVGQPFGLRWPGLIGIYLTGKMNGWTSAKDVILKVCSLLTVKGGTGHIVEYFGPGTHAISATGKGTICNMGAEHGATTSLFPFDERMFAYLKATGRGEWATCAHTLANELKPDPEVEKTPEKFFDRVLEIDLNKLEPHICGPHTPDLAHTVSEFRGFVQRENHPKDIKYAMIGSCTNSSYEDMDRSASVVRDALNKKLKLKIPLMVTPGSEQVFNTIKRDGQMQTFMEIGVTVLANACGPCIGQWQRDDIKKGERNSIISSFNRNFRARNDGNVETLSFIASPEIVTAFALAGNLTFNPLSDTLLSTDGKMVNLSEPKGLELPKKDFDMRTAGYCEPTNDGGDSDVIINTKSERLQALAPFPAWDGKDFSELPILLKATGQCTTDHISPAGVWLKYRGHLDRISDNLFTGATNAFTDEIGVGKNVLTHEAHVPFPHVARDYKAKGVGWVVIGDENYGEGSSREHAAMEPRHLNGKAVIVKSFARIHETNLKKQGILPLIFADPKDYNKFQENDRVGILGLKDLAPERPLQVAIKHADGSLDKIAVTHTLTAEQITWFKAGSALNKIAHDLKTHAKN